MSQQNFSPLKQALAAIDRLQAQVKTLQNAQKESIAIVGLGLRLPGGVGSAEQLWDVLLAGKDAVGPVPANRWDGEALFDPDPDSVGKLAMRAGAFLEDVEGFDAAFFGLTADEAAMLDPQQRLVLEVAWRALEDAGIAPDSLAGSATGVYLGIAASDWREMAHSDPAGMTAFSETGGSHSVAAGRLSYLLDLKGPAISVDTACSSSLVAVHQAVRALRAGDCDLALAGGVSLMLTPEGLMGTSRMRLLSPSGRCRSFDEKGDGVALGEGAALVALKRLSDAKKDGDKVLGLVRGAALNHDGRSNGLTAPNGPSQIAVIKKALADAGATAGQVSFVETHGTGTPLGDPIELDGLAATYGQAADAPGPCLLGAVKSNYGHLAAAAGILGLIKTLLVLRERTVPANLHFDSLNPDCDLAGTRLQLAGSAPQEGALSPGALGAVSSFGWSGTNAHVVLQAPQEDLATDPSAEAEDERTEGDLWILPLSAKTPEALEALKSSWADWLGPEGGGKGQSLNRLCASAVYGRQQFALRFVAYGKDRAALIASLSQEQELASLPETARNYLAGRPCNWQEVYGPRRDGALPGYPWQRQSFALLRRVAGSDPAQSSDQEGEAAGSLARHLQALPLQERKATLLHEIRCLIADLIGAADEGAVPPDSGFFQLGMTSLGAVNLHKKLEHLVGKEIPRTLAFQQFTATSVVDYLAEGPLSELFEDSKGPAPVQQTVQKQEASVAEVADELEAALARLSGDSAGEGA
ncbi:type I polyketide synthase [Rhodovibrionaceae bacterium A322]